MSLNDYGEMTRNKFFSKIGLWLWLLEAKPLPCGLFALFYPKRISFSILSGLKWDCLYKQKGKFWVGAKFAFLQALKRCSREALHTAFVDYFKLL